MLHLLHQLYLSLYRLAAIRIEQFVLFVNLHSYLLVCWLVKTDANHCISPLPDLFPYDVVVKRALVGEDHSIIVGIIFLRGIRVLLLEWRYICIWMILGYYWLSVFIILCGASWVRHVFFALIILWLLLLDLRHWSLLNLICNTCNSLCIIEIYSFDLLRGWMCHYVILWRGLKFVSKSSFVLISCRIKSGHLVSWGDWGLLNWVNPEILFRDLPGIMRLMKILCSIGRLEQVCLLLF